MTDSSDPSRRSARSSREPTTLDLTAKVVDEGARRDERSPPQESATATASTSEAARADAAKEAMLEGAPSDDPAAPETHAGAMPEPSGEGSGFGTFVAVGVLSGLVGAGAVLAFQAWRPAAVPSDPRVAALEQRVAALPRPDTTALERRLSALEGAQNGLAQRVEAAQALAQRGVARADEAFNRPAPAAPAAPSTPQPANDGALADLTTRIEALEGRLREQAEAAAGERQSIRQSLEGAAGAAQGVERRLAEQEQRLAALSRRVEEAGGETARAGTRLVLTNRLDAALRDGAPYREVLEGLRRAGADAARLSALEPFAQQGAPTAAALAQSFKPAAERIAEATRPPPSQPAPAPAASDSWTDRFAGLLGKVVRVRPVDAPQAKEPSAVGQSQGPATATIEQALARGDLAAAAAAWDGLPEASRQASADWGQQLKQRAAAEAASRALATDAVAALNQQAR